MSANTEPTGSRAAPAGAGRRRIVVISAGMGAGHDGAADGLQRRLEERGFGVDRYDFLDMLPAGLGRLLRGTYHQLLTWAPAGYRRIYAATEQAPRPGAAVRALLRAAGRRAVRTVGADTAAVVSTYPGASQVLGALRRSGALRVPAVTYLTDFSVHALWVAPGVDLHLAVHAIPGAEARARGATAVTVAGPVVRPGFRPAAPGERLAARRHFGLPEQAPLALLVSGSWGVGAVERAAAEIRGSGAAVPVVVCGHNRALAARLAAAGVGHVHGWVREMPELMRACDVLVQNAGGLTSLEAFASGLPVASYRCIPGHGRANAAALQEAGLALWIRQAPELAAGLRDVLHGPLGARQRALGLELFAPGRDPVAAVAAVAAVAERAPAPAVPPAARVRRRPRLALAMAATAVVAGLGIGAPVVEAYADSPQSFGAITHLLEGDSK
ncbi:glycosyltransferase [Streptomyces sp. NPDC021224]|uniref:glycosyltransferase n=1 Tax=unclassified Streptomyces TaxID=2593676 RepID=UPI00379BF3A2